MRIFYIALNALLPRLRRRYFKPSGGPKGCHYRCLSCNRFTTEHGGYSGYSTKKGAELCKACYERRRRWDWKYWLETGEVVEVPEVDGDGYVSPSTRRAWRSYKVYRLFGYEFVSATAARTGRQNSLNARYWFSDLELEGNSQGVEKARSARGDVMILPVAS